MEKYNFTNKEKTFALRIMKPFKELTDKNPCLFDQFLEQQLVSMSAEPIIHPSAKELLEGMLFKISMAKAEEEIEKMLLDESYGEVAVENTKAASYNSLRNISEKHKQILEVLKKHPGVSRREIAMILDWPINRVTPRVKELQNANQIKTVGTKWDQTTERHVEILEAV